MDKDKLKQLELEGMFERLDHEVDLFYQALDSKGEDIDDEYAEKVMRSQLEDIGAVVESMSRHLGEGEKISITTPSQLNNED